MQGSRRREHIEVTDAEVETITDPHVYQQHLLEVWREEIFGPVLSIMPFDSEDEAIALANDTPYGLAAYIQTGDMDRARRVAAQLRAGMIQVNGASRLSGSPFGGYKQSGVGREGGMWGIEEFLEIKTISGIV